MESMLEVPIDSAVCETCAERGRPHEPVFKMGMCEFCFKGLPHPNAPRKELARERTGCRYGMYDGKKHILSLTNVSRTFARNF